MKSQLRLLSGRKIKSPESQLVRPTTAIVREALMNILQKDLYNSTWLDLYSGSGIIGCEAIERGAKKIVAIEANRKTYKTCYANLNNIANANEKVVLIEVMNTEASKFLKAGFKKYSLKLNTRMNKSRFDYIYDP